MTPPPRGPEEPSQLIMGRGVTKREVVSSSLPLPHSVTNRPCPILIFMCVTHLRAAPSLCLCFYYLPLIYYYPLPTTARAHSLRSLSSIIPHRLPVPLLLSFCQEYANVLNTRIRLSYLASFPFFDTAYDFRNHSYH